MKRGNDVNKTKVFLFLFSIILFIGLTNATVTCSQNSIILNYNQSQIPLGDISLTACSSSNLTFISLTGTGVGTYINKGSDTDTINSTKTIKINISSSIPIGQYPISLSFSDGSNPISIILNINQQEQQQSTGECNIDIFPTIMNNIKVQQGEIKTRNIQVNVPSCYKSYLNLNGVILATDEKPIQLGELSLGQILPGNSVNIPIELNAVSVAVGTYQDTLSILAYNSSGNKINLPSVSVSVLVTAGINPITNFSFTQLPSCSISSTILNLNNTYQLTCTKNNPNIAINPIIDNTFITGISVEETATQYVYNFKAKNVGVTNISAKFIYSNAEIGDRYSQEIKITNSGTSGVGGTTLDFVFYQGGTQVSINNLKARDTIINVVDNQTRNLLSSRNLYINGVEFTNSTPTFEIGKSYEIRATAFGYLDRVISFNVSAAQITISLMPKKDVYYVGDSINITSNIDNCSILLDDSIITSPYIFVTPGIFSLKLVKEGYITSEINITINGKISYTNIFPSDLSKLKKGDKVSMQLTEDSIWNVYYREEYIQNNEKNYKDPVVLTSGIGGNVSFEINTNGFYEVRAKKDIDSSDSVIFNNLITDKDIDFIKFFKDYWYYFVIGLAVILILVIIVRRKNKKESDQVPYGNSSSDSSFEGETNYG